MEADQFDKLRSLLAQASAKGLGDNPGQHSLRFALALITEDAAILATEQSWSQSTSDQMTGLGMRIEQQVETGHKNDARMSTNSAVQIAARSNMRDTAASILLYEAWAEALKSRGTPLSARLNYVSQLSAGSLLHKRWRW